MYWYKYVDWLVDDIIFQNVPNDLFTCKLKQGIQAGFSNSFDVEAAQRPTIKSNYLSLVLGLRD